MLHSSICPRFRATYRVNLSYPSDDWSRLGSLVFDDYSDYNWYPSESHYDGDVSKGNLGLLVRPTSQVNEQIEWHETKGEYCRYGGHNHTTK